MKKALLLIILSISFIGCPVTCIVNPPSHDYLSRTDSATMNGVLTNRSETTGLVDGVLPDEEMPCTLTYYGQNVSDYEGGLTNFDCSTTSGVAGIFSLELDLPEAGSYSLRFSAPLIQTESRLVSFISDLEEAGDQKVYVDWEGEAELVDGALFSAFSRTLNPTVLDEYFGYDEYYTEEMVAALVKPEVERHFSAYFDPLRVSLVEDPDSETQRISMASCGGETDITSCSFFPSGLTFLAVEGGDFSNQYLSEDRIQIIVARLMLDLIFVEYEDWGFFYEWDPFEERLQDVARPIAITAAHEMGHALGLVHASRMYGDDLGHNIPTVPLLAAFRNIPTEIMADPSQPIIPVNDSEMCDLSLRFRAGREERSAFAPPLERCPKRFNSFNHQYLQIVQ